MVNIDSRTSELESGVVYASFDKALTELKAHGLEVVSLPQNAELRIQEGADSYVSQNGNYVREGVIYIPNKGRYLIRNSPLLQLELVQEAVKAHRQEREYSIQKALAKEYEDKSSQDPNSEVFHLTDLRAIPTNNFDKDKRALWIFQDKAEDYGKFLYDADIKEMHLCFNEEGYINSQENPFANQLWLRGLGLCDGSGIDGDYRDLGLDDVRGVRPISGEAAMQKISRKKSELYTNEQIQHYLDIAKNIRKGELPASQLEEIIEFFQTLRIK